MNSRNGFLFAALMVLFIAIFGVSCEKESTNALQPLPPKIERKFKIKKCYTYDYTDTGGYVLSNINTKVYNERIKPMEIRTLLTTITSKTNS